MHIILYQDHVPGRLNHNSQSWKNENLYEQRPVSNIRHHSVSTCSIIGFAYKGKAWTSAVN
eukprot:6191017-Pleurochrysis_carterae.AAC.4